MLRHQNDIHRKSHNVSRTTMRHGSLFSGIGGFDLAAEWMGWENVFHCEWMEFPRKVLDYHFPDADSHIDICKTDFTKYANKIDILTGGFPCQPFSLAGKRKGTDDERYLWGEMLRAIQEIKPRFVIAENVFGITNIDGGLVFEQVCLDLEAEGYEVQPFIIPAAAKNAPHRRDRCWFIATNSKSNGSPISKLGESESKQQVQTRSDIDGFESLGNATDTTSIGLHRQKHKQKLGSTRRSKFQFGKSKIKRNAPDTNGNDGRSTNRESGCQESKANGEGQQSIYSRIGSTSNEGDASDTNGDGFIKQWRYDSSRQINARSNTSGKWSANSKNFDNGDTSTNIIGQSIVDGGIGEQANVETNQLTTAKRICGVDQECDQCKGIIANDRCENVNYRALVQDGHERIQSSKHRGMDKNCGDISSDRTNECENDGANINRMGGDATDTNGIGQKLSKKRHGSQNSGSFKSSKQLPKLQPQRWDKFPTQSPICGGDDGLPTKLDGITFPKWRAESIKGYGNAIVPQIAYQLFQIINEL